MDMVPAESCLKYKFDQFDWFSLHLHTPAHQGIGHVDDQMQRKILYLDSPYIMRCDLAPLEKKAAALYKTKHTFILTAGASQGMLAAIVALGRSHRRVWVQRNCHKSVIGGLILSGIEPVFFAPASPTLVADDLRQLFANEKHEDPPTSIVLTTPTYEGWGCDIATCVRICRERGLSVVVDEAHGSLWPASSSLPLSAISTKADIVVHSLHKYCGSVVQSALVHIPIASTITVQDYSDALELVESTSKSNMILLNIEETMDAMFQTTFHERIDLALKRMSDLRRMISGGPGELEVYEPDQSVCDPFKLFLRSPVATSQELVQLLAEERIDYELCYENGVLLIFSPYHSTEHMDHFQNSLQNILAKLRQRSAKIPYKPMALYNSPYMAISPRAAHFHRHGHEEVTLGQSMGRVASRMVASCPPGWPLVIPGEVLSEWHTQQLGADYRVLVVK